MPGRAFISIGYPYAHNGQERNGSIFEGALSAENWMYDSRTLRRWEMDPMGYDWQSPYATFNGNPIYFSDPDGLYGDPPGVATRKVTPKTLTKTYGQIVAEVLEKELNTVVKAGVWTAEKFFAVVGSVLSPANSGYAGPGYDNGGSEVIGTILDPSFKPMEKITLDPSTLTSQDLLDIKARVEMGKGSFNDHQTYNKTFAPAVQGPFVTQSHHVIPVSVFKDIAGSELVAVAMQDEDFRKWVNSEMNLLPLGTDVHRNHPAYIRHVRGEIKGLELQYGSVDSETGAKLLRKLSGELKGEIISRLRQNPGKTLNEVFGGGRSSPTKQSSGKSSSSKQSKGRWRGKDSTMGTHDGT